MNLLLDTCLQCHVEVNRDLANKALACFLQSCAEDEEEEDEEGKEKTFEVFWISRQGIRFDQSQMVL